MFQSPQHNNNDNNVDRIWSYLVNFYNISGHLKCTVLLYVLLVIVELLLKIEMTE